MKNSFFAFLICFLCLINVCKSEEINCNKVYDECINKLNTNYNKNIESKKEINDSISIVSISNQAIVEIDKYEKQLNSLSICNSQITQLENEKDKYLALIIEYTKSGDISDIKNNGIAKAICYAVDLITGNFGKAVMSLFIILVGMSFLSGQSEAVSFKYLISTAIAIALIFGSAQLADIISGNKYSCKMVNQK